MAPELRSLRHQHKIRVLLLIFLSAACCAGLWQRSPAIATQSPINRAEIMQILDSAEVYIQNKQAKVKDSANKGQRVRTADARAQLQFNTGAIGRLAHNSVLTVGQCARLQKGSLLVNGAMNGCTSSVVAGVRGTTYVLEVNETGEANIKVLEGEVTLTRQTETMPEEEATEAPAAAPKQLPTEDMNPVVLKEGEQVNVSPTGVPGAIDRISQDEFTRLLAGSLFNGFTIPLPGISKIQSSFQRLFPGVPFPISVPGLPIPRIPIRLPFF
jgi:hypothetical protein